MTKPVYQGTYAEYQRLPWNIKQYYTAPPKTPPSPLPSQTPKPGYASVEKRKQTGTQIYKKQGVTGLSTWGAYGAPAVEVQEGYEISGVEPKTVEVTPKGSRIPVQKQVLEVQIQEKPKPLGFGEMGYIATKVSEDIFVAATGQQKSPVGKALIRGQFSPLYFAAGEVGTLEADIVGLASIPTSIYESARTGRLQYKQAWDVQLSPTVIGSSIGAALGSPTEGEALMQRPLAYRVGAAFGEASFLVIGSEASGKIVHKFVAPKVEDWLYKSYRSSVESGKLWVPSKTQKLAMSLTGARTPRLAGQIVSMPKEVSLDVFEFAVSPRSSGLFTELPKAPRFAQQIVSIPFKEAVVAGGRTVPVVSKQLLEAQQFSWDLMQTPKSSGVMLWKTTVKDTSKHYLHLFSRQGYTTIGSLLYEKPFSSGFLSAPSGILVTTTVTRSLGKKMPYYPQVFEPTKRTVTKVPYTPTFSTGKAASSIIGFPVLTPKKRKGKTKTVISPFTTPHLFPDIRRKEEQRDIAVSIVGSTTAQKSRQRQFITPTTVLDIPTPNIPDIPTPPPPSPSTPPPSIPKIPTTPKLPKFPFFPRAGGDSATRSFSRLFGRWYPRKHKVKTWEQQLGTFGFKPPKGLGKFGKVESFGDLGKATKSFTLVKTHKKRKKKRRRKKR